MPRPRDTGAPAGSGGQTPTHVFPGATIGRFTGASVSGLVVGAMGLVVFALYFRQWLKERRPGGPAPDAPC